MAKLKALVLDRANTELALAEGSAAETDARARRNALSAALRADERRLAATLAFTFEAVVDYR
jgi:hypothetical protein